MTILFFSQKFFIHGLRGIDPQKCPKVMFFGNNFQAFCWIWWNLSKICMIWNVMFRHRPDIWEILNPDIIPLICCNNGISRTNDSHALVWLETIPKMISWLYCKDTTKCNYLTQKFNAYFERINRLWRWLVTNKLNISVC